MGKTKKLIELDDKAIEILTKQAKLQKRSLKNYIEFTLEDTALRFSEQSEEYKVMMDKMLDKMEKDDIDFIPVETFRNKYDL
jgi:CRISPR/Cas system CSM-associated protein Csm2 small subunit